MSEIEIWLSILGFYFFPAYLIGSVPYGYLFGCFKGINIQQHGSGNIGATNVWRVMGKGWGIMTFILDFLKVPLSFWLSDILCELCGAISFGDRLHSVVRITVFLGGVLGHNYPVWLKFKGGKGIATSAGGLLWLMPAAFVTVFLVWMLIFSISRYVALASIMSAAALPIAAWVFYPKEVLLFMLSCFLGAMAIWRHHSNIRRLIHGTELKWGDRSDIKQGGSS